MKFPISHSETICESGDEEYVEEFVSEDSYDMDDEHDYVPPKHKNRNKFQENPGTVNATIKNRGKISMAGNKTNVNSPFRGP